MSRITKSSVEAIAALAVSVPATSERFRMERSVVSKNNFDLLKNISKDRIPETLLEYICYEHQYNVFGYGVLDPEQFNYELRFTEFAGHASEIAQECAQKQSSAQRAAVMPSPEQQISQ